MDCGSYSKTHTDIGDILQNVTNIQIQVNNGMPELRKKFGLKIKF